MFLVLTLCGMFRNAQPSLEDLIAAWNEVAQGPAGVLGSRGQLCKLLDEGLVPAVVETLYEKNRAPGTSVIQRTAMAAELIEARQKNLSGAQSILLGEA